MKYLKSCGKKPHETHMTRLKKIYYQIIGFLPQPFQIYLCLLTLVVQITLFVGQVRGACVFFAHNKKSSGTSTKEQTKEQK